MPKEDELDQELIEGLKDAKSKRCHFVLVMKGGADGALVISKTKIGAPAIAAAKKRSGGSAVIKGMVRYEGGEYIFEIAKEPANTMENAIKTIVRRDTGNSIRLACKKATDPELLAATADGDSTTTAKTEPTQAKTPFSGADFDKARATWISTKQKIHSDMESLSSAIESEVPEEADLGGQLVEYIDDMLANLDNSLESALKDVSKAGTDADRDKAKTSALAVLDRYLKTVAINPGVKQVETNPMMPLGILKPLAASLEPIKRQLSA